MRTVVVLAEAGIRFLRQFWIPAFAGMTLFFASLAYASGTPGGSPHAQLSDAEREYYEQHFNYAMQALKTGGTHSWQTYRGAGTFTAGESFKNSSGTPCRSYTETYRIGNVAGTKEGYACKRQGAEGWCQLNDASFLSCALEPPKSEWDALMRKKDDIFRKGQGAATEAESWWPF